MRSWNFTNLGVSTTKDNETLLKQLMECVGVDFGKSSQGIERVKIFFEFHYDLGGAFKGTLVDSKKFFYIVNRLFENTYVYYEHEYGNDTSDDYNRNEAIFDPVKRKCFEGSYSYCYGDATVFGEPVYMLIKDECEEAARKQGIQIVWDEDYFVPRDEFSVLCSDILRSHGGLSRLGTKKDEYPINLNDYNKKCFKTKYLDKIIKKAAAKGYTELTALISQKFGNMRSTDIDKTSTQH